MDRSGKVDRERMTDRERGREREREREGESERGREKGFLSPRLSYAQRMAVSESLIDLTAAKAEIHRLQVCVCV